MSSRSNLDRNPDPKPNPIPDPALSSPVPAIPPILTSPPTLPDPKSPTCPLDHNVSNPIPDPIPDPSLFSPAIPPTPTSQNTNNGWEPDLHHPEELPAELPNNQFNPNPPLDNAQISSRIDEPSFDTGNSFDFDSLIQTQQQHPTTHPQETHQYPQTYQSQFEHTQNIPDQYTIPQEIPTNFWDNGNEGEWFNNQIQHQQYQNYQQDIGVAYYQQDNTAVGVGFYQGDNTFVDDAVVVNENHYHQDIVSQEPLPKISPQLTNQQRLPNPKLSPNNHQQQPSPTTTHKISPQLPPLQPPPPTTTPHILPPTTQLNPLIRTPRQKRTEIPTLPTLTLPALAHPDPRSRGHCFCTWSSLGKLVIVNIQRRRNVMVKDGVQVISEKPFSSDVRLCKAGDFIEKIEKKGIDEKIGEGGLVWRVIKVLENWKNDYTKLLSILYTPSNPTTPSEIIQNHLLLGQKNQAFSYTLANQYLSHALIIGSRIGVEAYGDACLAVGRGERVLEVGVLLRFFYAVVGGKGCFAVDDLFVDGNTDIWMDCLAIILANKSPGDEKVVLALGDRLAMVGEIEHAHICYLIVSLTNPTIISGPDDPLTKIVLLGLPPNSPPTIQSILDTQLLESTLSLHLPHFQAYKLIYAYHLTSLGHLSTALEYCIKIQEFVKSYSKGSPYLHKTFLEAHRTLLDRINVSMMMMENEEKKGGKSWIGNGLMSGLNKFMSSAVGIDDLDGKNVVTGRPGSGLGKFMNLNYDDSMHDTTLVNENNNQYDVNSFTYDQQQQTTYNQQQATYDHGSYYQNSYSAENYYQYDSRQSEHNQEQENYSDYQQTDSNIYDAQQSEQQEQNYTQTGYQQGFNQQTDSNIYDAQQSEEQQNYSDYQQGFNQQTDSNIYDAQQSEQQQNYSQGFNQQTDQYPSSSQYQQSDYQQSDSSLQRQSDSYDFNQTKSYKKQQPHYNGPELVQSNSYEPEQSHYNQQQDFDNQQSNSYDQKQAEKPHYNQQQDFDFANQQSNSYDQKQAEKPHYNQQQDFDFANQQSNSYDQKQAENPHYNQQQDSDLVDKQQAEHPPQFNQPSYDQQSDSFNKQPSYPNGNTNVNQPPPKQGSSYNNQSIDDDDDDFGFGNKSSGGGNKKVDEVVMEEDKVESKSDDNKTKISLQDQKSIVSTLFGWMGKKKPTDLSDSTKPGGPVKAKMGKALGMYYDNDLKKWVDPNGPPPEIEKPIAPPPMMNSAPSTPPTPNATPIHSNSRVPTPTPIGSPAIRKGRSKYVDILGGTPTAGSLSGLAPPNSFTGNTLEPKIMMPSTVTTASAWTPMTTSSDDDKRSFGGLTKASPSLQANRVFRRPEQGVNSRSHSRAASVESLGGEKKVLPRDI